jgi:hypothetical protein
MTGDAFTVDSAELTSASSAVATVAGMVRTCQGAADADGVGDGLLGSLIYGVLFDPIAVPVITDAKNKFTQSLTAAAGAADGISSSLKANADDYASIDSQVDQSFQKINGYLPGSAS